MAVPAARAAGSSPGSKKRTDSGSSAGFAMVVPGEIFGRADLDVEVIHAEVQHRLGGEFLHGAGDAGFPGAAGAVEKDDAAGHGALSFPLGEVSDFETDSSLPR